MPHLLILFLIPLIASSLFFLILPFFKVKLKLYAFILSLLPLFFLLFHRGEWIGSSVDYVWIAPLSIHFHLSLNPLSEIFLYLTALIVPFSLLAIAKDEALNNSYFYGLVLLLEACLIGFFTSEDLVLFTLFWESMLIPLFFIILLGGGQNAQRAALKFLVYMIAGSCMMIAAVIALHFAALKETHLSTFDFETCAKIAEHSVYAPWILGAFLLAFSVKTPLFPFHAWLPEAYAEAPTSGSILLAAILSKAGIYGVIKVAMGFFPNLMEEWSPTLIIFALIGVFYGGFSAWIQNDLKKLIAYSSFSHVNFILIGLFVSNKIGLQGAVLQSINHAITILALFLVVGWLIQRMETSSLNRYSGLAQLFPKLCWVTLFFVLASLAVPGTNNFIGELMIFFALIQKNAILTGLLGTSIILSPLYMLRWMQKIYFGPSPSTVFVMEDIKLKELAMALTLIFLIIGIGIYPKPVLNKIEAIDMKTMNLSEKL